MRPRRIHRFRRPRPEHLEDRRLLDCEAVQLERTLFIRGDETANFVEIAADGFSLRVTCDGQPVGAFNDVNVLLMALEKPRAGMKFNAEEALGAEAIKDTDGDGLPEIVDVFGSFAFFEFISGDGAQRFDIKPGAVEGSLEMDVADADDGFHRMQIRGLVGIEQITVEGNGGDDVFDLATPPPAGTDITLSGRGASQPPVSHRLYRLFAPLATGDRAASISPRGRIPGKININGVLGENNVIVYGDRNPDLFDIGHGANQDSTQIILSDIARTAPVQILAEGIESLTAIGGAGEDLFEIIGPLTTDVIVHEKDGRGASQLQGTLFIAKQQALRDRNPYGVRLIEGQGLTSIGSDIDERFDIRPGQEPGLIQVEMTERETGQLLVRANVEDLATLMVKGGDGDDQFNVHGPIAAALQVSGEIGNDKVTLSATEAADQIDVTGIAGDQVDLVEVRVSDAITMSPLAYILSEGVELQTIEAGFGDDVINIGVPDAFRTRLALFGQEGNDGFRSYEVAGADHVRRDEHELNEIDLGGGPGLDRVKMEGSIRPELFEFVGVPVQGFPDPEVRITDLETNLLTDVIAFVEFEEFALDAGDGDDKVVMREEGAPLSDIDWTINTGGGHDIFDGQMAALPDELRILAGDGNDDVSVRFVGTPEFRDPNDPVPIIDVDMRAGVDGLLLDVYGSPSGPPSDFVAQVTLVEVLAAIQVSGLGLMSLLTLFPLGALDMRQAIQDDRAGHTDTNVSMLVAGANFTAELSTAATQDSILIDLIPRPESQIALHLATGEGSDNIEVRSKSSAIPLDFSLAIEPGTAFFGLPEKVDDVVVHFEHGDPDRPVIIGTLWNSSAPPDTTLNAGGTLTLHTTQQDEGPVLDFDFIGGPGPDNFDSDWHVYTASVLLCDNLLVDGDDLIDVNLLIADEQIQPRVRIDSGDGNDAVTVLLRRLANPHLPPNPQSSTDSALNVITGSGDDVIDIKVQSAAERSLHEVHIDAGEGNNDVRVTTAEPSRGSRDDIIVAAPVNGHVKSFEGQTLAVLDSFFAHPGFMGEVTVGAGDGTGPGKYFATGGGGQVNVYDRDTGALVISLLPYGAFRGGVYVAVGDVDGDGFEDIITGTGSSATHVKVFSGRDFGELASFFAYPGTAQGVRVAAGDVNGDGRDDIITAPTGIAAHVKVFSGAGFGELASFFAFPPAAGVGAYVGAGDVNGDGRDDIVVGADAALAHIKVFSGATLGELASFIANPGAFGVRVAAGDVDGDGRDDIIAATTAPVSLVSVFDAATLGIRASFFAFPGLSASIYVAAGDVHGTDAALTADSTSAQRLELDLMINAAGGDDAVAVQLGATADELVQTVQIDTGDGVDKVAVNVRENHSDGPVDSIVGAGVAAGPLSKVFDLDLAIETAAGKDAVVVNLSPTSSDVLRQNVQIDTGPHADNVQFFYHILPYIEQDDLFRFDLGAGDDFFQGVVLYTEPFTGLIAVGTVDLLVGAGSGNDKLSLNFRGTILEGAAVDVVLAAGAGNDQVRSRFDLGPQQPRPTVNPRPGRGW